MEAEHCISPWRCQPKHGPAFRMPLIDFKNRRERGTAARALYGQAVAQARRPVFYARLGVPDTLDGRFELISLHVFLLLRRLSKEGSGAEKLAQAIFDLMFADMDQSLRELGVGDLAVGRRVKAMVKALYGRIAAYEEGLAGDDGVLAAALARNLFGTAAARAPDLAALCAYVRREAAALARRPLAVLCRGQADFGALTEAELGQITF